MEVAPYFLLLLELLGVVGRCVLSVLVYMLRLVVPASRKSLRDKRVLVTGAGHGLGREIALRCAQLGAKLVLLDINKSLFRRDDRKYKAVVATELGQRLKWTLGEGRPGAPKRSSQGAPPLTPQSRTLVSSRTCSLSFTLSIEVPASPLDLSLWQAVAEARTANPGSLYNDRSVRAPAGFNGRARHNVLLHFWPSPSSSYKPYPTTIPRTFLRTALLGGNAPVVIRTGVMHLKWLYDLLQE
ncbi:hypothetical protein HPB51_018756 [Rhipicephalus microplus]|uniref:Hydroxysteroid 17-beta dehydrogenase 11 n=1 Tax=Rhipicephalus microplus TaxID=6941 RepID=A0A9J6DIU8_RHIMP|nr:hypothetical protein HPB51_018756 [Rhipicephalus microplus]